MRPSSPPVETSGNVCSGFSASAACPEPVEGFSITRVREVKTMLHGTSRPCTTSSTVYATSFCIGGIVLLSFCEKGEAPSQYTTKTIVPRIMRDIPIAKDEVGFMAYLFTSVSQGDAL